MRFIVGVFGARYRKSREQRGQQQYVCARTWIFFGRGPDFSQMIEKN